MESLKFSITIIICFAFSTISSIQRNVQEYDGEWYIDGPTQVQGGDEVTYELLCDGYDCPPVSQSASWGVLYGTKTQESVGGTNYVKIKWDAVTSPQSAYVSFNDSQSTGYLLLDVTINP